MNATVDPKLVHAWSQAQAQLKSITEMVAALDAAGDDDRAREEAQQTIDEDPLSVEVRSNWHAPGLGTPDAYDAEYTILLCTGGPAVRIIGELDNYHQPDSARLECQDWGTPWTEYPVPYGEARDALLAYARCFYFGE